MSGGGQGRDGRQEPPRAAGCRQQVGRAARGGRRCRAVPMPFPLPPAPVLTTCGGGRSPPGPGQRPVHCGRSPPENPRMTEATTNTREEQAQGEERAREKSFAVCRCAVRCTTTWV
ncbi:rabphilin-3A-like [Onychostruthus taczanowskii]|uniref:rabphilin-3A-like n=1 Tax=Onychostruthus taczanowskii TaxID=356909 RepID=UPI001B809D3A|nr:rabphilin-3A-like [Onychostruthus taczanowskii]